MKRAAAVKYVFKDLIPLLIYVYSYIYISLPTKMKHKLNKYLQPQLKLNMLLA